MTDYQEVAGRFGAVLDAVLTRHGLTDKRAAELCGIDRTYVSKLRTGSRVPRLTTVYTICHALPLAPLERDALAMAAVGGPFDAGLGRYLDDRLQLHSRVGAALNALSDLDAADVIVVRGVQLNDDLWRVIRERREEASTA